MAKGYNTCDVEASPQTVSEVLDGMPFGRFHVSHVCWAVLALTILAIQYEMTPYMFPGLEQHFGAGREELSTFAASWQAGCAFGTLVAPALADRMGRKPTLTFGVTVAAIMSSFSTCSKSLHMLLVLRTVTAASWAIAWNTLSPWYIEFLPTRTRGAMLGALCLGWPIGRGIAIAWSQLLHTDWQSLQRLQGLTLLILALGTRLVRESPRFLASRGRTDEAQEILESIHRINGGQWKARCLCLDDSSESLDERTLHQLFSRDYIARISFCWILFSLLACTTILMDTWGPLIYQHLLFPHANVLPHGLLMLFTISDLVGLVVSIFVIDIIGRKGGFAIGFLLQGSVLLVLAGVHQQAHKLDTNSIYLQSFLGMLAAGCRSFAWEGASLWTLEAFPTSLRAAALCSSRVCLQLAAVLTLKVSADYMAHYPAMQWLQLIGCAMIFSSLLVALLNPQETAGLPLEGSRH